MSTCHGPAERRALTFTQNKQGQALYLSRLEIFFSIYSLSLSSSLSLSLSLPSPSLSLSTLSLYLPTLSLPLHLPFHPSLQEELPRSFVQLLIILDLEQVYKIRVCKGQTWLGACCVHLPSRAREAVSEAEHSEHNDFQASGRGGQGTRFSHVIDQGRSKYHIECVYIYIHTYIHTYIHIYIQTYIHEYGEGLIEHLPFEAFCPRDGGGGG